MLAVCELDFQHPDEKSIAAATLIAAAVYHNRADACPDAQTYIARIDPDITTHYGLVRDGTELVGVAATMHGIAYTTEIPAFAIEPAERGKKHGRFLMQRVAEIAGTKGDKFLGLDPRESKFFSRLGFSFVRRDGHTRRMEASVSTVLEVSRN